MVAALTPPAPVRLAVGAGFCAVAEAAGAALELTFGLGVCTWAAVLVAAPAAVLAVLLLAVVVVLEAADFESAAVDSVDPAKLAAVAFPVLETLPAV